MAKSSQLDFSSRPLAKLRSGLAAARPASPEGVGDAYWATDTHVLSVANTAGTGWDSYDLDGLGVADAQSVSYTPTTPGDWVDPDPVNVEEALDDAAARLVVLEALGTPDAAIVTYTPAVLTDWNSDADPGDVDNALDQLADRVDTLEAAGGITFIGAKVRHNTTQSVGDSSTISVAFNTEDFDTDSMHDTATNNSRLICKTAGKFLVQFSLEFDSVGVSTGRALANLRLNGTTGFSGISMPFHSVDQQFSYSEVFDLAVNDYMEVRVFQNSGASRDLKANCRFSMVRIGN